MLETPDHREEASGIPTYVQAPGKDTWHWCRNCNNYPVSVGQRVTLHSKDRPGSGGLCKTCLGKEGNRTCQS
jgi:hypothetical protein